MLTPLLVIPLLGAIAIAILKPQFSRFLGGAFSLASLVWSLYLFSQFDLSLGGLQFSEFHRWIDPVGLNYSLGVDGLSLPLLALNSLLTLIALYTNRSNLERTRLHDSLILLINAGIAGALMAQNLLLFIIFYELELIPFYLLISIWGGEKRGYAATKFLLYTAVSGLLVLAGFLGATFLSQSPSFEFSDLQVQNLDLIPQLILLTTLLIGFGIKIPLVPLHTWMPDTYVEASPATTVLLGGIFAKLGTYGLLRFGLQLFPTAWQTVAPGLAIIGTVSVIYGAVSAIAQRDIKRMVAYSSIGHMGYILVAAAAGTELSVLGAIAQMVAHGLILALLFFLVGIVEKTTGTRDLGVLNGLMNPVRGLPLTSSLLILAGMASAGIPGLVGFAAEFIVFQGSFATFPIPTLLCIISSGLTAVYFVILINRTCFGKLDNDRAYYTRIGFSQQWPALVLTAIILYFGVQPNALLHWIEPTTNSLVVELHQPAIAQIATTNP
ncbi:NADH-quinone oxidoreductase subunit M [Spirulina major CS-329]|uniref:NADH-quinone oxidoreductase subunit M n=1 Tax=Spirulina TaxID=1154 RepID=UPI002330318A|nr:MULTISPECIES: NADH-quinone oxidoreductase subunit M [Spirulina]MDB9496670.1 NADH-quinone oxidoreductase subunit M [Spirulina subsalsa CS-330]MDB9503354.1 NADH-quinone oxidoreductase subunit M [Spirulina major CS-329]